MTTGFKCAAAFPRALFVLWFGGLAGCKDSSVTEMIEFSASVHGVAIEAGAVVPWEYGTQGGSMIVIDLSLPPDHFEDGETVEVEMVHEEADGPFLVTPEFVEQSVSRRVVARGERVTVQIQDQHSTQPLTGGVLMLTLSVRAPGREGVLQATITMGEPWEAPPPPSPSGVCAGFERTTGGGCNHYFFPGTGTITAMEVDGTVRVDFLTDDPINAQACSEREARLGSPFEDGRMATSFSTTECCLAALEVGNTTLGTASVLYEGTCGPGSVDLEPFEACSACL